MLGRAGKDSSTSFHKAQGCPLDCGLVCCFWLRAKGRERFVLEWDGTNNCLQGTRGQATLLCVSLMFLVKNYVCVFVYVCVEPVYVERVCVVSM